MELTRPALGPWLATVGRLLVGGVFLVAGILKLLENPTAAVLAVRAYRLLPEALVRPVAFGLPVLEIAVGFALIVGIFVRTASILSALMLTAFMVGIVSAWARGLQIDCGCFGSGGEVGAGQTTYGWDLIRDGALLLVALALARWPRSRLALGQRWTASAGDNTSEADSIESETEYTGA